VERGAEYRYPHDAPDGFVDAWNLPTAAGEARYYEPKGNGGEGPIGERLALWRARRRPPAR
jgi:putative ATPase